MRYKLILLVAALMAVSCFKKTTTDTELIIKTMIQETSGGDNIPTTDVFAYACYTQTNKWKVASYEDALNRIVTDSLGVERITVPDVESTVYQREGDINPYICLPLNQSPAFVVLVCPQTRMYATLWKYLNVENLPQTYMTLILHSWKSSPYTEGVATKGGVWNIQPPAAEQPEQAENN